eukprot:TRINITY_DN8651_c0_g1_i1.p1 TRINITY_DN8651_c0_g1~~TRINITY_DN8651_c0_g1_i1.p1  ORF type:complete len:164 (+),score=14.39 TRINITY_DN8651_c0_g1_i1:283-774(+)
MSDATRTRQLIDSHDRESIVQFIADNIARCSSPQARAHLLQLNTLTRWKRFTESARREGGIVVRLPCGQPCIFFRPTCFQTVRHIGMRFIRDPIKPIEDLGPTTILVGFLVELMEPHVCQDASCPGFIGSACLTPVSGTAATIATTPCWHCALKATSHDSSCR